MRLRVALGASCVAQDAGYPPPMTQHTPALQPGQSWTPELAEAFVARHDLDVSAEVVRLEVEMGAAFPTGTLYTFRYDAATLAKGYPTRTLDAQILAFVQVRTASGAIHSATVHVVFKSGEVEVRGWPLHEGSR